MPKTKGGLGVLNLRLQNDALLLKQLHKFYMKFDTPWVHLIWHKYYSNKVPHAAREIGSFWWKDVLRLSTLYRGVAKCTLGNGSTITFWNDLWSDNILSYKYPRLFSFAIDPSISVQNTMQAADLASLFNLPLSEKALDELISLQMDIQDVNYDPVAQDSWSFIWGHSNYSSRQFYKLGFMHLRKPPTFTWIWKSKCTPRLKFFA